MVTYTKHCHTSHTRWFWLKHFKTGLTFFLPVLFILGLLPTLSAQITVDGNPGDWPATLNNNAYVSVYTKDIANASGSIDNQFTGGSQDPDLLSEWAWSLGSANDKGDISNAGAVMIGNKIYFFGDRTALNGDAAIGFWFFKNNVTMTGDGITSGAFSGSHAIGDILVLSHFTNGGGTVNIEVFKWVGSGGSDGSLDKLGASASNFAVVNTSNWPVPIYPQWAYEPKVGNAGTYYTGSFFEGVIDLSVLNIDPCFSKFLLETRNSQSVNASLQDLTFGGFDTKPIASLAPKTVCHGLSVTFTASVTGGLAPLQYSFNGGAFTNSNSITFTATTPQTITVVVKGANGCLSEPASAALNINQPSVFGTQPQPQTVCAPAPATFTVAVSASPAPTLQWQVNSGSGWTNLSNAGVYSGVTTNTLSISNSTGLNGYQYRAVGTNTCGEVFSTAAALTVNTAPAITSQPAPQIVCAPAGTSFTVAASGTPTPSYQWQVSTNGGTTYTNLANTGVYSGVTTNTLTISNSTGLGGNLYRAVATNTCGSVNSTGALLTVNVGPAVTNQPDPVTVCAPAPASFTVEVTGTPAPSIQWQVLSTAAGAVWTNLSNGGVYSNVTTTTLNISNSTGLSGYQYRAVVSNTCGTVNSNAAALTVNTAPAVTDQPDNTTVCSPGSASFAVTVTGTPTPTLQWQVNSGSGWTNLSNGGVYSGVTTATLSISNTTGLNGYQYRIIATNSCGSATSNAAILTVNEGPTFTSPEPRTVCAPNATSFSITASGTPTPSIQWQVSTNGGTTYTNLANAGVYSGVTTNTLSISNSTGLGGYLYRAVITNTCGNVNTASALLTVNTAPAITTQPTPKTVCAPTGTTFNVAASGTPAPSIQWQVLSTAAGAIWTNLTNTGVYSGVTTTTLTISNSTGLNGYQYRAVATNTCGSANSNAAALTVNTAPAITAHPAPVTVCAPEPASFTVAASGTPTPSYQWQVSTNGGTTYTNLANAGVYSGVTTNTLSISNTSGLNGYLYRAAATNTCGTVYSTGALLTVEICDTYCTYTQGAYGNEGGKHCIGELGSTQLSTFDVIKNAIGTYPNDKMIIGKAGQSVYMTNADADVDAIIEYLPGGGGSRPLNAGDVSISNAAAMAQYLKGGRINNTLLAQTMTLGINLGVKSNLSGFTLQANKYLVTAEVEECGSSDIKECRWAWNATTMQYEVVYTPYEVFEAIPQALYDAISPKTVGGLFAYANKALGGDPLATGVSYNMIAGAVDMINNAFDECRLFIGWEATAVDPTSYCQPQMTTGTGLSREVTNETLATTDLKVAAYPNPFNSSVNFNFTAPVSGKALLEVYDLVGRRLAVVFEGQVDAGMQKAVNYKVPSAQRIPMIYRLSIGGKTSFGKLLPGNTD